MKIKGLKKLIASGVNYDLNVEVMSGFKKDEVAVKAFLTLFTPEQKIIKKATAIASSIDFNSAQNLATEAVLERAGF